MQRITEAMLETKCTIINEMMGTPTESWTYGINGSYGKSNVGNFHIDRAYGGVRLDQMTNESGGIRVVLDTGYTTKRDLMNRMESFIDGIRMARKAI